MPFGMLGWTAQMTEGNGGPYQYFRESLIGFMATHQPSAWMSNYGAFSLMPITGMLQVQPGERASHFSRANEQATPYRYSVLLDASHGGGAVVVHTEGNSITGKNGSGAGNSPNFAQYFVAVFDHAIARHGVWEIPENRQGRPLQNQPAVIASIGNLRDGNRVGVYAGFATKEGEAVTVRIGVSLISVEQARRNLAPEMPQADFDGIAERAKLAWERQLGKIDVEGGTEAQRRTFYTALYHAVQFPHMLQETDSAGMMVHWSPYDGKVHAGEMFADRAFGTPSGPSFRC